MSDGIMDNQTVETADLNAIAVDLGATTFNGFTTNKFGAAELNKITQALVSKGVLLSGKTQCKPMVSDGKFYIQPGTIVFNSGARKTITESVEIEKTAGTHIYAYTDGITACIKATAELPASGDYVRLAKVDASGKLTDNREFAKGKALSGVANTVIKREEYVYCYSDNYVGEKETVTVDVGFGGFNYLLGYDSWGVLQVSEFGDDDRAGFIIFESDSTKGGYTDTITVTREGTTITLSGRRSYKSGSSGYKVKIILV